MVRKQQTLAYRCKGKASRRIGTFVAPENGHVCYTESYVHQQASWTKASHLADANQNLLTKFEDGQIVPHFLVWVARWVGSGGPKKKHLFGVCLPFRWGPCAPRRKCGPAILVGALCPKQEVCASCFGWGPLPQEQVLASQGFFVASNAEQGIGCAALGVGDHSRGLGVGPPSIFLCPQVTCTSRAPGFPHELSMDTKPKPIKLVFTFSHSIR